MSNIKVNFAVYGALKGGNEINGRAKDVRSLLQELIDQNNGVVDITSSQMGTIPCLLDSAKSFGAQIQRAGSTYHYACQEGQTIDFTFGGYRLENGIGTNH